METTDLTVLEQQVDRLLNRIERLRMENRSLHTQVANISRERSRLQESRQKAATDVKRIISQLKEEMT